MATEFALNALTSVTISNLLASNDGLLPPQALTLLRRSALPAPPIKQASVLNRESGFPFPKPPSLLPPPGNLAMETLLPDPFVGRCGSVFRTQVTHLADADGNPIALDTVVMPELVLKVARRARRPFLAHEAWFYEEMESLQGVTVPRCYGYFHGELQSGLSVNMKGWLESWPHQLNWFDEPGNTRVCVLLLERVGGLTEPGQKPFPHREDLVDAMEDLTCLSIVHGDIRWENILHATPDSSVASASTGAGIMCPRHQVIHHYRFIDFEDAYRTNMLKQRIQEDAKDHLDHLLDMMEDGFVRD